MTLRQLLWLAEGHGRDRWSRTALLCTVIANAHRDPKKGRLFKVSDFSPYKQESSGEVIRVTKDNIGKLKEAFEQFKHRRM